MHLLARPLAWAGAGLTLSAGCQYDIDKLFEHDAGGAETDGGGSPSEPPEDLIDLWSDDQLSEECKACARSGCKGESDSCRGDEECLAFTTCVATAQNPAEQNSCRAQHTEWLRQDIQLRDVGGPYHTCVFQNVCPGECGSRTSQSCASAAYTWPKSSASTIWLHLQLLEGQGSRPVPGARVRACQSENTAECRELSDGWAETDDKGVVDLEVSLSLGTFLGYLEVEGGDLYPSLIQFGWPVGRDMTTRVTMVSEMNATFLLKSVIPPVATPAEVSAMRGFIQARAFSCAGVPAQDVSFQVNNGDKYTQIWYTPGALIFPDFEADGTSELGAGGLINVPVGLRTLTARYDGEVISRPPAPVRAGYMTIVFVVPGGT
ncbi:MAG TPA: hypothetical protein VFZ61_29765 [Polyangiales bacterium]